jgi:MFS transporter, DHA3 family, tetracycline resistance protein
LSTYLLPRPPRHAAYPAYLILEGGYALAFSLATTVNLVWQAQVAGLTPFQLVLVGTVLETTTLLGEVPTGVIADVFSRRLSIVLGMLLMGSGFLIEGLNPRLDAILLAQVEWGLGATCLSGATQAWISDEIGADAAGRAFLRAAQVAQLCTFIAIPISVGLANLALNTPIVLGASLMLVLGVYLALAMPETRFHPAPASARHTFQSAGRTLRDGTRVVRGSPLLVTLLLLAAILGMATEGIDRLSTPHLLQNVPFPPLGNLEPVTWFGMLRGGWLLLSIGAAEVVRRKLDLSDERTVVRFLFIADGVRIVSTLVFAFASAFAVAAAALWTGAVLRRLSGPVYMGWLNRQLESSTRATVLSMSGQMDALGQIVGGPAIGALANVSLRAAIAVTGLSLAPALVLYARARRQLASAAASQSKADSCIVTSNL